MHRHLLLLVLLPLVSACSSQAPAPARQPRDTIASVVTPPSSGGKARGRRPALSPLADTIAQRLTFTPSTQTWFTAASRGKRMLIDIGRVDIEVQKDTSRHAAYQEAVRQFSPVTVGTRFRLYGPWGTDTAAVTGFDSWKGRIVAVLQVPPRVDSLARVSDPLPAAALRTDSLSVAQASQCNREMPKALEEPALYVRDSLEQWLLYTSAPPYERFLNRTDIMSWEIPGCFGDGRVLVLVSLRAGDHEYVTERAVLLDGEGRQIPLRLHDLRLKAHDPLYAFDADGDGVDDLATRAYTERAGALAILRLDMSRRRFERLTSGFAWESF